MELLPMLLAYLHWLQPVLMYLQDTMPMISDFFFDHAPMISAFFSSDYSAVISALSNYMPVIYAFFSSSLSFVYIYLEKIFFFTIVIIIALIIAVAPVKVKRRRPGELYSDNMQTVMDTLQEETRADQGPAQEEEGVDDSVETLAAPDNKKQQEQALRAVQQAMDLRDARQLEVAIGRCEDLEVPEDHPLIVKARRLLFALRIKAELMETISKINHRYMDHDGGGGGGGIRRRRRDHIINDVGDDDDETSALMETFQKRDSRCLVAGDDEDGRGGGLDDVIDEDHDDDYDDDHDESAELMEASQKRDLASLERAIERAKEANFENFLDLQIAMASRLRDNLVRLEKLRHAVLNMEQKTVSEIKSYQNPPAGIHESMMATFLLLGSPLKDVKQWRTCLTLMAKTGRESMMRKISQFDPRTVPLRAAQQARRVTQAFSTDQIRDASAGAATFYIWAQGMIEEVESYGGAEQADQLRLQK